MENFKRKPLHRSLKHEVKERIEAIADEKGVEVEDLPFEVWDEVMEDVQGQWEYERELWEDR